MKIIFTIRTYDGHQYFLEENNGDMRFTPIQGKAQVRNIEERNRLHEKIKQLNNEYNREEAELYKLAMTAWTDEEIARAKEESKKEGKTNMHPIFTEALKPFNIK